jgi:glucokinase
MSGYVIGFDIGGTRIKYGIIAINDGTLIKSENMPSMYNAGPQLLYDTLINCICDIQGSIPGELKAIGLGLTGCVDPKLGVVMLPGKFKELENFPIVELLKKEFNIPVFADNDGRLAAYAEKFYGHAKDKNWAVIITIGTGIGSGVIIDGKIPIDPHLLFGVQLGHIIINKSDDRTCLTGNFGTGEILCSSTALGLQVRSAIQRGIPSSLTDDYFNDPFSINFHKVIEACRAGDQLCLKELDVWVNNLAILLINAVHIYAPEIIILSGGATLGADMFLDRLTEVVNNQVFRYPKNEPVDIVISNMPEYSGVIGAAVMAKERLKLVI